MAVLAGLQLMSNSHSIKDGHRLQEQPIEEVQHKIAVFGAESLTAHIQGKHGFREP